MKTLFTIGSGNITSDTLLLEVGRDHCSYAFMNKSEGKFEEISYISFDECQEDESLTEIISSLKGRGVENVVVCAAYTQALLVPQHIFKNNFALLDIIYDVRGRRHLKDLVPEWQIVNLYSIPEKLQQLVFNNFPSSSYYHAYTPALKYFNSVGSGNQINVHFGTTEFRVMVKKDSIVQLAQIYSYKTPLDVIYFLLKICYEFSLEQSEVIVVLSGLVDQRSALYDELHHYFLHLHFTGNTEFTLPENDYPEYYFTSLYNLASCVS